MTRDTFKAKGEPPVTMNDNQKETLKFLYQFLYDLADPDSRLHMSTEDLAESADRIKDQVECNFGADVLGVPLQNNSVKGIVFTEQERNFCIDALNLLHMRKKNMLKNSEIEVLEVLIDDFKGPRWEESKDRQRIRKKNARLEKVKKESLKRRVKDAHNAGLEIEDE